MGRQGFGDLVALVGAEDEVVIEPGDEVADGELLAAGVALGDLLLVPRGHLAGERALTALASPSRICFRGSSAARWAAVMGRRIISTYFLAASRRVCSPARAICVALLGRRAADDPDDVVFRAEDRAELLHVLLDLAVGVECDRGHSDHSPLDLGRRQP